MGQIKMEGSILIGPVTGGDNQFPNATSNVSLATQPNPKPSAVDNGFATRTINSSSAFVELPAIGPDGDVVKCDTFYFKCQQKMRVRVTFGDTPADLVSELIVVGTLILEADPSTNYIKLVEVKGTGPIEYLASGLS